MFTKYAPIIITGGGQKVCTGRVVLPVADNIFKWMYFASVCMVLGHK